MEPEDSSPHSHGPATCPYSEPDQSKSYPRITPVEDPFLILSSHLRLRLSSGLFPLDFPTKKPRMHFSSPPLALHVWWRGGTAKRCTRCSTVVCPHVSVDENWAGPRASLDALESGCWESNNEHSVVDPVYQPHCSGSPIYSEVVRSDSSLTRTFAFTACNNVLTRISS